MKDFSFTTHENDLIQVYTANGYSTVVLEVEEQDNQVPKKYSVLHLSPSEAATLGVRLIALASFCDDEV